MVSEINIENIPSTLSNSIKVIIEGLPDEKANFLSLVVRNIISNIGKVIKLDNLYGITIAVNYSDALERLDLGRKTLSPLSYTNTDKITGIAQAVTVFRDDLPYTYLVFNALYILPLIENKNINFIIGLIAHECAHVELNEEKRSLAEFRLDTSIKDFKHRIALQAAEVFWDEYAACLISSSFNNTEKDSHIEMALTAVETAYEKANQAICVYRVHGDINTLISQAGEAIILPLRMISYLFGDIDYSYFYNEKDIDWSYIEDVRQKFIEKDYFIFADKLWIELRRLWKTRKKWESISVFKNIEDIVSDIFKSIGITFLLQDDGQYWVDVKK